jgi:2-oxoisovalerate dehydrogenase E1 component
VQESGQAQGMGDQLISLIVRQTTATLKCAPRLIASRDVPVPFAPELEGEYRPNAQRIQAAIEEMLGGR